MIVAVIRHAKVDHKWKPRMTSAEYDKGCAEYDADPVLPVTVKLPVKEFQTIYVSGLPRTAATARQVFGNREMRTDPMINEVPARSGFDTNLRLPGAVWSMTCRIQWLLNNRHQPETRSETKLRAKKFVKYLIEKNEDCAVFTHGFFMITLLNEMEKQGFHLDHKKLNFSNGEVVVCEK